MHGGSVGLFLPAPRAWRPLHPQWVPLGRGEGGVWPKPRKGTFLVVGSTARLGKPLGRFIHAYAVAHLLPFCLFLVKAFRHVFLEDVFCSAFELPSQEAPKTKKVEEKLISKILSVF